MRCPMSACWSAPATVLALLATLPEISPARAEPPVTTAPASQPATRPVAPTEAQVEQAIRQLNHPAHARRRAAIRQLAEWGPVVFPQLRRAAKSDNTETAISARELLHELESAILIGAYVSLEVDRPRVAWNEPFTLTVHAVNPTNEKIEVPWPATDQTPTTRTASTAPSSPPLDQEKPGGVSEFEARQVGALMDAGDFLVVTGPDGRSLDVRVDPIERDPSVYAAVNVRAAGVPPSHPMPAGAADRLLIPLFNRGWARYPMLAAGRYTIAFSYQPRWNDDSWTQDGFGLVQSAPISIEITAPAPEAIRAADQPLRLVVKRDGDTLAAELESTWDREMWINLNMGDDRSTHAQLDWRLNANEDDEDSDVLRWDPEVTEERLTAERFRLLRPGERFIVGRAPVAALGALLRRAAHPPEPVEVTAKYIHLPLPAQIREAAADRGQTIEVPTQLFSGTVASEPVRLFAP